MTYRHSGVIGAALVLFAAAVPAAAQQRPTNQDRLHTALMRCDEGQRPAPPQSCAAATDALLRFYGSEEALREAHGVFRMAIAMPQQQKATARTASRQSPQSK